MTRKALAASAVAMILAAVTGCTGGSGAKHGPSAACGFTPGSVTPPRKVDDSTTAVDLVGGYHAGGVQYAAANDAVHVFPVADVGAYYVTDQGVGLLTTGGIVKWSLQGKVASAVAADRSLVVQTGTAIAAIGEARGAVVSCVHDSSAIGPASAFYLDQPGVGSTGLPVDFERMSRLSSTGGDGQSATVAQQLELPEYNDDTAAYSQDFTAIGGAFGSWALVGATNGFAVLGGYQTPVGETRDAYVQLAFVGRPAYLKGDGPGPEVSEVGNGADVVVVRLTAPVRAVPAGTTWLGEKVRGVSSAGTVVLQDVYNDANGVTHLGAIAAYSARGTRLWTAPAVQEVAVSDGGVLGVSVVGDGALELTNWNETSGKVTARTKLAAHTDPSQPLQLYGQSSQVWVVNGRSIAYVYTGDGKLQNSDVFDVATGADLVRFEVGGGASAAAVTVVSGAHRSVSLIDGP